MANSYPASGTVILDDLKVCTSARLQPSFTSTGEHMFLTLESAHLNSYLPIVTFARAGCSLGVIGLERASNSDSLGNYTESEMLVGTRANTPTSIQTSGVRRIVVSSGGNISIGASSPFPAPKVDIRSSCSLTSAVGQPIFVGSNDVTGPLGVTIQHICGHGVCRVDITSTRYGISGNDLSLNVDSSDPNTGGGLYIKYRGNVGIGTSNPSYNLHVESGSPRIHIKGTSGDAGIFMKASSSTAGWTVKDNGSNEFTIFSDSAGTHRLYINSTGKVGLGTTSPGSELQIVGPNASGADFGAELRVWENSFGAILQGSTKGNTYAFLGNFRYNFTTETNSTTTYFRSGHGLLFKDGVHIFSSEPGGTSGCAFTPAERLTINNSGNIGIGTTSPSSKLDVSGADGKIQSRVDSSDGSTINVRPNAGKCGWISYTEDAVADRWGIGVKNGDAKLYFASGNVASGGGTTRMIIDGGGCVGINTTTPSYHLHVNGTFYAAGSSIEYKEGICQYNTDSCLFMCLKPVTYQYKDEFKHLGKELKSETQIGLIAEDVAESYPELAILVNEEDNKVVRNVDYEKLSIILLSELQKLRKEVDELKQ